MRIKEGRLEIAYRTTADDERIGQTRRDVNAPQTRFGNFFVKRFHRILVDEQRVVSSTARSDDDDDGLVLDETHVVERAVRRHGNDQFLKTRIDGNRVDATSRRRRRRQIDGVEKVHLTNAD